MRPERVFVKGDRRVTTRVPAAAVRFLSEGFREVIDDESAEPAQHDRGGLLPPGMGLANGAGGTEYILPPSVSTVLRPEVDHSSSS